MRGFDYEPRVEISAASGVLRVTIEPRPSAFLMVLEAAGILLFSGFTVQLSGSEEVLFDPEKLSSRKNTLGWERTREYSVQECSEREWKAQSRRDHPCLQGKVGWRTVHFCDYISQDQAAMKSWLPFNAICRKSFKRWERCRAAASPISPRSD